MAVAHLLRAAAAACVSWVACASRLAAQTVTELFHCAANHSLHLDVHAWTSKHRDGRAAPGSRGMETISPGGAEQQRHRSAAANALRLPGLWSCPAGVTQ